MLLPAVSLAALVVLAACPSASVNRPANQLMLSLSDFPETGVTYSAVLQSFDSDGNYLETIDLGPADASSTIDKAVTVHPAAAGIGVYLLSTPTSEPDFFMFAWLVDVPSGAVTMRFWADYDAYFSRGLFVYGLNSRQAREIVDGQAVDLDYYDAPYYILRDSAAQGRSFQVALENLQASSSIEVTPSITSYYQGNRTPVARTLNPDAILAWSSTSMNLVVTPADVRVATSARVTVTDITEQAAKWPEQTFPFGGVVLADGGATLVFADTTSKALKEWDVSTGNVTTIKTFTDPLRVLTSDGGVIFVGAGTQLYTYDPATDATVPRATFTGTISSISPAGGYLLIDDSSGAWSTFSLVRKSDFTTTSQRTWVWPSRTSVFVPSQSRVYLLRDGVTPNDICYQEIDFGTETLGTYGDSPYHGDYTLAHPLVQLGSDMKLVCNGNIFDITDSSTASKIKWWGSLGTQAVDLLFLSDRILALGYDRLSSLDPASPYPAVAVNLTFTGETGKKLFETPAGILVISTVSQTGRIVVRQLSFTDLGVGSKSAIPARRSIRLDPRASPHAFQR